MCFYYIGDFACRFEFNWTISLYQKSMMLSLFYDEKINFWFWKEPPLNKETDL
jgi:hypothetical protein